MGKATTILAGAAFAAALLAGSAASAAVYISPLVFQGGGAIAVGFGDNGVGTADTANACFNYAGPPAHVAGCASHDYNAGPAGDQNMPNKYDGSFTDVFSFQLPTGDLNGGLISISIGNGSDLKFTSIDFNGVAGTVVNMAGFATAVFNVTSVLSGGPQVLTIHGMADRNASYNGNASFIAAPVPEPMTWALMIIGFAGIGMAARSRRRTPAFG